MQPIYTGEAAAVDNFQPGFYGGAVNNSSGSEATLVDDGAGTFYTVGDHLGTAQMELASNGQPVWKGEFAPFGQELSEKSSAATRYKFTGKERDEETDFDYFGARYYASNQGRWISPDWAQKVEPIPYAKTDNPQTLNLYMYVGDNPELYIDADGHKWLTLDHVKTALDIASFIPGVGTAAGVASAGISIYQGNYREAALSVAAAVPVVGLIGEAGKGAKLLREASLTTRLAENAAKGAKAEKEALAAAGLVKNTEKMVAADAKTGALGATIPDAVRANGATVEVKNVQRLNDSAQLRRQSTISAQSGQKAEIISTNPSAKVSSTVRERMNVTTHRP